MMKGVYNRLRRRLLASKGFTIVELMIATVIFSSILLIVSYGIVQFTHDYYQGINTSTTQNLARNISDTIAQAVQFSGADIAPTDTTGSTSGYLCAGGYEFIYDLGRQVDDANSTALIQFANGQNCVTSPHPPTAATGWPTRVELLQPRMRLLKFAVKQLPAGNLWQVDVRIALGDNDQLCSPSVAGSCNVGGSLSAADFNSAATLATMKCKSQQGSQFCSVSELSTVVQKRVN